MSLRRATVAAVTLVLLATAAAHAKGRIRFVNDSRTKWKIELYKGDDRVRCKAGSVSYRTVHLKPGEHETATCKGENTGGCYVEVTVQDHLGEFRSLLREDADWSCAKVNGDAQMRLTGDWSGTGYSLNLTCYRTDDPDDSTKSCVVRFVDD
jgi:hypothetical protein